MTTVQILARDHGKTWALNTGTEAIPVWTAIKFLKSWGHSPTKNDADTTNFDDDGRTSHMAASRGDEFTITASYMEDPDTGVRDTGQKAVETLGEKLGYDSLGQFRLTSPGGIVKTFAASVNVTVGGGGNDDNSAWEASLTVSGAITTVNP